MISLHGTNQWGRPAFFLVWLRVGDWSSGWTHKIKVFFKQIQDACGKQRNFGWVTVEVWLPKRQSMRWWQYNQFQGRNLPDADINTLNQRPVTHHWPIWRSKRAGSSKFIMLACRSTKVFRWLNCLFIQLLSYHSSFNHLRWQTECFNLEWHLKGGADETEKY